MGNIKNIYFDWNKAGSCQVRQYDHLSNRVIFGNAPKFENYYLLVAMKESESDEQAKEMSPILLTSPVWLIPNSYTQMVQQIKFQICNQAADGSFEQHSAEYTIDVLKSHDHEGEDIDVDPSPMYDAYKEYVDDRIEELIDEAGGISVDTREYVDEKIQTMIAAAGDVAIDTTLSVAGAAADAKATGDAISETNERLNNTTADLSNQNAILNALNGVNGTLTPIKLQGIDATPEGTMYTQSNNHETYYVPVAKGGYYSITAEKSSGAPYYKLTFSSAIPSVGTEYTYIEKKTSVAVFNYTANSNGYLCVSVYKNQTASVICNEMQYGEIQIIDSNIKTLDSAAYTQIDVGTSARTIEMDTSPIKAKSILSYEGDETPVTWAGGLAIYKNIALIGYNLGYFAMFDLLTGGLVATGRSEDINAHNNNIFFDTSIITNGYPLLYASDCRVNHTECYVYTLSVSNGVLTLTKVQTITYSGASYSTDQTVDWCYDADKDEIIALISKNDAPCSILKFSKPAVFFASVALTDADIISTSTNSDITVRQDATVANGYLFVLNGFSYGDLIVINIDNGETVNTFSLTPMDLHEPEGVAFANGVIYVNFHHGVNRITAYLYKLNF